MKSGPQAIYIGYPDASRMLSDVRRLCGHCSTGPTGVRDHSIERMSLPISPPPAKTASARASSRIVADSFRGTHRIWNSLGHEAPRLAHIDSVAATVATHERGSQASLGVGSLE